MEQWSEELAQRRREDEALAADAAAGSTPAATRAALQTAVERHRAAVELVAKLETGKRNIVDVFWDTHAERDAATAELTTIRASTAEATIATAIGDAPATPRESVRRAEIDFEDAELQLTNARNAQASIEARLVDAKQSLAMRADRMRDAATAAITATSAAWLRTFTSDTIQLLATLADRRHALAWLQSNGMLRTDDAATKELLLNLEAAPHHWTMPPGSAGALATRWEGMVTELCSSPAKARAQLS